MTQRNGSTIEIKHSTKKMILSQQQLKTLSETLNDKIPDLLNHFSIEFIEHEDRYTFCCPIHIGDNLNGACIYKSTGIFRCWTQSCHTNSSQGILGFIHTILDSKTSGSSFPKAVEWAYKFLGKKLEKVDYDEPTQDIYKQNRLLEIFNKKPVKEMQTISRESVLRNLDIPSRYFIGRGFSKEVLVKFDVGECTQPNKPMSGRAVVPVYDIYGRYVGCSGRSIVEKDKNSSIYIKWMNSKGFMKSQHLYGINLAQDDIIKKRAVFLVEGPGDVWRMHEAGFGNTVAILGAALSDDQLLILESLLIDEIIIATDSDIAGIAAYNQIIKKIARRFRHSKISIPNKDIGETSIEDLNKILSKYK